MIPGAQPMPGQPMPGQPMPGQPMPSGMPGGAPMQAPGIYAPYQPRFDWNLWFASLSTWRQELIIVRTEQSLLRGDADVLLLFAGSPFPHAPPHQVRAVIWQY